MLLNSEFRVVTGYLSNCPFPRKWPRRTWVNMFLKSSSNSLCNYNKTKHNKLCAYCMDCAAQVHVYNLLGGANVNHMETTRQEIETEKQWYRVTGFMMASWHRNTFCIAGTLWRKPLVTNGFISQRPLKRNFDVLCVVNMNKPLNKSSAWWT